MSLSIGIIGLPNVGKSTLFNALTRSRQADAQNYPFCTIDPNVGVVEVPDERLSKIANVSQSKRTVPTAIKFIDIAGLVKGAAEGAGLGNKFLSHIREVDAIAHVVRAFADSNVTHVHSRVDPKEDVEVINFELALADWQTVNRHLETIQKKAKAVAAKERAVELDLLARLSDQLEAGKPARALSYSEVEMALVQELRLLTMKPMLYVVNVDEMQNAKFKMQDFGFSDAQTVYVCAKLESGLTDLNEVEVKEYLQEAGVEQLGLDKIIVAGYRLLDLVTYFTSGEPETRAWTVKKNTKAPDAAGVIHTDFIKGFIKAEVVNWEDFVADRGWTGAKEAGKCRLEGKEYVVRDGDVCYFHVAT